MGFKVKMGTSQRIWCPVDSAAGSPDTLYVGQIVEAAGDGVLPINAAAGISDTTGKAVPFGVIVGTNNRNPVFDATYLSQKITGADTQALQLAREYFGAEGQWGKGDPQALVEVELIDPTTVLEGPLFKTAYGTPPAVLTVASGTDTDGLMTANATTGAWAVTPVADKCAIYCRSGANKGLTRITIDTSTTQPVVDTAFPYVVAIGDTFVRVPFRPIGCSFVQFDSESMYIDVEANPATNYYILDVLSLDLSTPGKETMLFRFNADQFCKVRA